MFYIVVIFSSLFYTPPAMCALFKIVDICQVQETLTKKMHFSKEKLLCRKFAVYC